MAASITPTVAPTRRPPKPKAPKQAPSFEVAKANTLHKLLNADKSPKGSLDAPIAALVHAINDHADYVST
eukprot:1317086-Prymnesium_polylepis.1